MLPRLELSYVPLEELRPSARKLRKLDPAHVREVASSISVLGFCDPLLVGRGNELIDGEARYEAAKQWRLFYPTFVTVASAAPSSTGADRRLFAYSAATKLGLVPPESDRLDKNQRRHGQSLSLAA